MSEMYWQSREDVIAFYLAKGYDQAAAEERADVWERLRTAREAETS